MEERPAHVSRTYHSDARDRERARDPRKEQRIRPTDLPVPKTKEEAEAQAGVCRAHIADIDSALQRATASRFKSAEDFENWRDRTSYARSQWESRLSVALYDVEHLATREAGMQRLALENERLRAELTRLNAKSESRRINTRLERTWMLAVLLGDAPADHRNAIIKDLQTRINSKYYLSWIERAKKANWKRVGPMGRFDLGSETGHDGA